MIFRLSRLVGYVSFREEIKIFQLYHEHKV